MSRDGGGLEGGVGGTDDMLHVKCHGTAGAPLASFAQYRDIFFFDLCVCPSPPSFISDGKKRIVA